jgi:RNA polymerase sigma-70 factor (ECF subfamily)
MTDIDGSDQAGALRMDRESPSSWKDSVATVDPFGLLYSAAQGGSQHAIGELLEGCRQYLTLIADRELEQHLRPKAGASDLVQDSFLEAQRCFHEFTGDSESDLLAWLRGILLHNLADFVRRYERTEKRRVSRELPLEAAVNDTSNGLDLSSDSQTPSGWLMRQERLDALRAALTRLRGDDQRVLILRYQDGLTFAEIGRQMQRSPDAARMLWSRALDRLSRLLETEDG